MTMAKASPAKIKKLQGEAKRAAAARKAEKAQSRLAALHAGVEEDNYAEVDQEWVAIGLAAPARRALIDDGHYTLSDLRKVSLAALKELHGMGPNAIRILVAEMKKQDIQFRN
jgi:hypothetical protein